jgi:hypothetical protein
MTQALNLALFANFVNSSGQVSASGLQAGVIPASFPSGTLMLFQQTSAPTGWTKQTTHDNKALRVVSGTASSGGTTGFTTVFTNQSPTTGATTLSTSQIPSHLHSIAAWATGSGSGTIIAGASAPGLGNDVNQDSRSTGGGSSHTHTGGTVTLNVQYVDLIIASKN